MKFHSLSVIVVLTVFFVVAKASSSDKKHKSKNNQSDANKSLMDNCKPEQNHSKQNPCHSEAVRRCGKSFMSKMIKLEKKGAIIVKKKEETRTPEEKNDLYLIYTKKCKLREDFLDCVTRKRKEKKPCKAQGQNKPKYRQKLKEVAEKLWSTRDCIIGYDERD